MAEASGPEGYVGVEEAAARLGVSRTKVWRLIKEGVLTTRVDVLDRRRKLIPLAEIDQLKAGRVEKHTMDAERPKGEPMI